MDAVKASPLIPAEFVAQFRELALAQGFREERFAVVADCPLAAFTRRAPGPRPRLYLSAGIHGDEPAAALALLHLLKGRAFTAQANWFLVPLLNPTGFLRRSRENADGVDLNRDYRHRTTAEVRGHVKWLERQPRFDAAFCLHEDWEASGYYVYALEAVRVPNYAEQVIARIKQSFPVDEHEVIDGRVAQGGIIRPDGAPEKRELWPEAIYLFAHHTHRCYTCESASASALADRVSAHLLAIGTALAPILSRPGGPPGT